MRIIGLSLFLSKSKSKIVETWRQSKLLDGFDIGHRIFGRYLTKTQLGKYSLCFDLFINKKDSLKKFYKHIGYSLPRKQSKLKSLVRGENATKII